LLYRNWVVSKPPSEKPKFSSTASVFRFGKSARSLPLSSPSLRSGLLWVQQTLSPRAHLLYRNWVVFKPPSEVPELWSPASFWADLRGRAPVPRFHIWSMPTTADSRPLDQGGWSSTHCDVSDRTPECLKRYVSSLQKRESSLHPRDPMDIYVQVYPLSVKTRSDGYWTVCLLQVPVGQTLVPSTEQI